MKKLFYAALAIMLCVGCAGNKTAEKASDLNSTTSILMVRPTTFSFNSQTAVNNAFMNRLAGDSVTVKALAEFDGAVETLRSNGIRVSVVEDTPEPLTPDAVFPNNWFSTHSDGTLVLYPMFARNRRQERKPAVMDTIKYLFPATKVLDFTTYEADSLFLEGTGSMVLDRVGKVAYACLSPRTTVEVFKDFCDKMGFKPIMFNAIDANGEPVYHTNVMMAVGTDIAILCEQSIADAAEFKAVKDELEGSGHTIVNISFDQMNHFAGNMLEVHNENGQVFIVMSATARQSLTDEQVAAISRKAGIIAIPIPTIETVGGGSIRCMMAEIYPVSL